MYYLIAEFSEEIEFYNHKSKKYEKKSSAIVKARGFNSFFKFYNNPKTEIIIISIEDKIILNTGELVLD